VYVASGTCSSGQAHAALIVAVSIRLRNQDSEPVFQLLGGSKLTIPSFHCGPKSRWYARLDSCGLFDAGNLWERPLIAVARAWRPRFSVRNGKEGIVSFEPPKVGKPFAVLVPQSDANGNDQGGVSLPELQVPLATYTDGTCAIRVLAPAICGSAFMAPSFLSRRLPRSAKNPAIRGFPLQNDTRRANSTWVSSQKRP